MNYPLVSVIMNCFNAEKYLEEAIQSVISQTYNNWEIIFWDNNSTDKSPEIVRSFQDKRIKYFKNSKTDIIYKARNLAIQKSSGSLIAFLDCDDIWKKDKLSEQLKLVSNEKKIIYGGYELIDRKGQKINKIYNSNKKFSTFNQLVFRKTVSIGSILIDSEILKNNLFNPEYHLMGDFELWFRLSLNYKFTNLNKIVELSRRHDENISKTEKSRLWVKERRMFYKDFFKNASFIRNPEIIIYILISELESLVLRR
tara:strand:+ start:1433 stop:2197 length:765 start_codon:yes stop_codon:yes gene_type:complete